MALEAAARQVREKAYAPYSNFKVGAAVRAGSGVIYTGCNVENVAYPEGTCAEAGAIAAMIAAGDSEILETFIIAGGPLPASPCGGCRQKLAEFSAGDMVITMATTDGAQRSQTMAEILPGAFDPDQMRES